MISSVVLFVVFAAGAAVMHLWKTAQAGAPTPATGVTMPTTGNLGDFALSIARNVVHSKIASAIEESILAAITAKVVKP